MSLDRISSNIPKTNSDNVRPKQVQIVDTTKVQIDSKIDKKEQTPTKENVEKAVNSINEFLQPTITSLKFEMHEELKEYYVKVVDSKTNEVVREIPSKKFLDMYAEMNRFIGLMVDKKI